MFDLNALSLPELRQLKIKVDAAIASYEARKLQEARELVQNQLHELGFKLEDLVAGPIKKTRTPAVAKYAHPENPNLTWSGRGRNPNWVVSHLENGGQLEDLAI